MNGWMLKARLESGRWLYGLACVEHGLVATMEAVPGERIRASSLRVLKGGRVPRPGERVWCTVEGCSQDLACAAGGVLNQGRPVTEVAWAEWEAVVETERQGGDEAGRA